MVCLPNEPYRQLFDSMVAFVLKHLIVRNERQNVEVDGIQIPTAGDELNVSMLNLITLQWMSKIQPDLLTIVRTEYAKDLTDNIPLASWSHEFLCL